MAARSIRLAHGRDSLQITGKIDRLDVAPDGSAYVIDYKYSAPAGTKKRVKNENLVQAPLYLMAAEKHFGLKPAGMFYVGLKGEIVYAGWKNSQPTDAAPVSIDVPIEGNPFPPQWLETAAARTLDVVSQIRSGRIEVAPADVANCRFCDSRDICRVETFEEAAAAGDPDDSLSIDQVEIAEGA
jgi:ATP-dependent helicase/nuclease subunit B